MAKPLRVYQPKTCCCFPLVLRTAHHDLLVIVAKPRCVRAQFTYAHVHDLSAWRSAGARGQGGELISNGDIRRAQNAVVHLCYPGCMDGPIQGRLPQWGWCITSHAVRDAIWETHGDLHVPV